MNEENLKKVIAEAMPGLLSVARGTTLTRLAYCGNLTRYITTWEMPISASEIAAYVANGHDVEIVAKALNDLCEPLEDAAMILRSYEDDTSMRSPKTGERLADIVDHKVLSIIREANNDEDIEIEVTDERTLVIDQEEGVPRDLLENLSSKLDQVVFHASGAEQYRDEVTLIGTCENVVVNAYLNCGEYSDDDYNASARMEITFCDTPEAAAELAESEAYKVRERWINERASAALSVCECEEDIDAALAIFAVQAADHKGRLQAEAKAAA